MHQLKVLKCAGGGSSDGGSCSVGHRPVGRRESGPCKARAAWVKRWPWSRLTRDRDCRNEKSSTVPNSKRATACCDTPPRRYQHSIHSRARPSSRPSQPPALLCCYLRLTSARWPINGLRGGSAQFILHQTFAGSPAASCPHRHLFQPRLTCYDDRRLLRLGTFSASIEAWFMAPCPTRPLERP